MDVITFHGGAHTYQNRRAFILKYFSVRYRRADCPAAQALTVCPAQAETGRLQSSSTS